MLIYDDEDNDLDGVDDVDDVDGDNEDVNNHHGHDHDDPHHACTLRATYTAPLSSSPFAVA